eukprot:CAMPEP_0170628970 /NCGR_PEP_ID=MMETSP0224-20130122/33033_1 /TAXON_ID=285029 /ORGANISM="Togula jolla, Strain CCCM 725" /LENGTH=226 /DNA_ID=CAMNT_0010956561 /DNA_START=1 /DNA_END=678 /DNA_ORIENTATION=-
MDAVRGARASLADVLWQRPASGPGSRARSASIGVRVGLEALPRSAVRSADAELPKPTPRGPGRGLPPTMAPHRPLPSLTPCEAPADKAVEEQILRDLELLDTRLAEKEASLKNIAENAETLRQQFAASKSEARSLREQATSIEQELAGAWEAAAGAPEVSEGCQLPATGDSALVSCGDEGAPDAAGADTSLRQEQDLHWVCCEVKSPGLRVLRHTGTFTESLTCMT